MHQVNSIRKRPEIKTNFDDRDWSPVSVADVEAEQLAPGQIAVFRARVEMTEADLNNVEWNLNFERVDDAGWIYVNGRSVGQANDWSRAFSFDVTKQLHPGVNVIAVVVRNDSGSGGLGAPGLSRVLKGTKVPLQYLGSPQGVEEQWWQPDLNDNNWQPIELNSDLARADGLLNWFRMNFQLPQLSPGVWVPWHLHLEAAGNGFLYLNGHAIGRYWDAGPQHDFFLPECWLNFGAGATNQITLSLRPTGQAVALRSATIEPYADFAEVR
jgi:hypothetical protein